MLLFTSLKIGSYAKIWVIINVLLFIITMVSEVMYYNNVNDIMILADLCANIIKPHIMYSVQHLEYSSTLK